MADMLSFRTLIVSFLIVGLFFVALINFGVQMGIDNYANMTILDNPSINSTYQSTKTNITTADNTFRTGEAAFDEEQAEKGSDAILKLSISSITTAFKAPFVGIFNAFMLMFNEVLGLNIIVIVTLGSILTLTIVLLAWRLLKTGE